MDLHARQRSAERVALAMVTLQDRIERLRLAASTTRTPRVEAALVASLQSHEGALRAERRTLDLLLSGIPSSFDD